MNFCRTIFFLATIFAVLPADVLASGRRGTKRDREDESAAASSSVAEEKNCPICCITMEPAIEVDGWIDQAPLAQEHVTHPIHRGCLAEWWKISQTCPICKRVATDEELAAMGAARLPVAAEPGQAESQLLRCLLAINTSNVDMLQELLAQGFDVNRELSFGRTALTLAVERSSSLDFVNTLLTAGANVNHRDYCGETALLIALEERNDPVTQRLLMVPGINLLCVNNRGFSAFFSAVRNADYDLFERLISLPGSEALLDKPAWTGEALLHVAAREGLPGMTRYLLNHGANPLRKNLVGETALDIARNLGNEDVVAVLEPVVAAHQARAEKAQALVGALARSKALQDTVGR